MARRNHTLQRPLRILTFREDTSHTQKRQSVAVSDESGCSHRQRKRFGEISRLASGLKQALQIREGDQLVFILGEGTERSNGEALITWVTRHLPLVEDLPVREQFAELQRRLVNQLMD